VDGGGAGGRSARPKNALAAFTPLILHLRNQWRATEWSPVAQTLESAAGGHGPGACRVWAQAAAKPQNARRAKADPMGSVFPQTRFLREPAPARVDTVGSDSAISECRACSEREQSVGVYERQAAAPRRARPSGSNRGLGRATPQNGVSATWSRGRTNGAVGSPGRVQSQPAWLSGPQDRPATTTAAGSGRLKRSLAPSAKTEAAGRLAGFWDLPKGAACFPKHMEFQPQRFGCRGATLRPSGFEQVVIR
jgi:hypothetical protein